MLRLVVVCAGGAVGSGLRYLVGLIAIRALGTAFPYGTLAVNVIGSFLIALILAYAGSTSRALSDATVLTLTTGVMGGFTTYSAFNEETLRFIEAGNSRVGLLYAICTFVACLLAGALGHRLFTGASNFF